MNLAIENMEAVLIEAHRVKGWQWVHEEPLWVTWPLEKFGMYYLIWLDFSSNNRFLVTSITTLLPPYHRSLDLHVKLVATLRSHSVSFEDSRNAISKWIEQPWLEGTSWDAKWEDICDTEVERWDR